MKKFIHRQDSVAVGHQQHRSDNLFKPRRLPVLGRLAVYEYTLLTIITGGRLEPSSDEKATVMSRGQMTKRQLENWLSNCRRRLFRCNPRVIEDKARKEIDIARRELKTNTERKRRDPIFDDDDRRRPRTSLPDERTSSGAGNSVVHHWTRSHTNSIRRHSHLFQDCTSIDDDNSESDDAPDVEVWPVTRSSAEGTERQVFRSNAASTPVQLSCETNFESCLDNSSGDHSPKTVTERFRETRPTTPPESVAGSRIFDAGWNGFSVLMETLATAAELIECSEHSQNCELEAMYLGRTNCYACSRVDGRLSQ